MQAIEDIFQIWDPMTDMARDLDIPYQTVAKWKQRGRIPSDAWQALVLAAQKRGHKLTLEQLANINPPRQGT